MPALPPSPKMPMTAEEMTKTESPIGGFLYGRDPESARLRTLAAGLIGWRVTGSPLGGLIAAAGWAFAKKEPLMSPPPPPPRPLTADELARASSVDWSAAHISRGEWEARVRSGAGFRGDSAELL